jgi:hypothetical protein
MTQATLDTRISATGFVIKYPAIESLAQDEQWFLCDANGLARSRGNGYNPQSCRAMVEAGTLIEHERIPHTGCVIYRQVTK